MTQSIIYIDRSVVRDGRVEEVREGVQQLVNFIEAREPQLIGYDFYFDSEEREMTVVAIHPDSESLERHLEIGRSAFQAFAELIDLRSIHVYGQPSDEVLRQLEDKTEMLGVDGQVEVHSRQAGFMRLDP